MEYLLLIVGSITCAVLAIRATRLLIASLWLAGVSVFTSIILYLIGAHMMAVIELSLSVGLITILLVFAIAMVGADSPDHLTSQLLNWPLIMAMLLLIIGLTLLVLSPQSNTQSTSEASFSTIFWQQRQGDVAAQIAMIFTGVMGLLGLLAESYSKRNESHQNGRSSELIKTERQESLVDLPAPDEALEPEREMV